MSSISSSGGAANNKDDDNTTPPPTATSAAVPASSSTPISSSSSSSLPNNKEKNKKKPAVKIVQYIILRRDLEWPAGAMAAQAAHVSVAAVTQALNQHYPPAIQYVSPEHLPHMTKVVYAADSETHLHSIQAAWTQFFESTASVSTEEASNCGESASGGGGGGDGSNNSYYYVWMEQPENIPTALATWPLVRTNQVSKFVKKLGLQYF